MLDALVMERQGIPAAPIVTKPFVSSGKAMALAQGFTDYSFAAIPHPIDAMDEATLKQRAIEVAKDVTGLLQTSYDKDEFF